MPRAVEILLVTLTYIVTARVGQYFAIDPGNITPVWIPSGIMFSWVVLRGYYIWPGIFLGAFIGNTWAYLDVSSIEQMLPGIFSGSANGVGDVLCSVGAVYLIRRFAGTADPFGRFRHFWYFMLFAVTLGPAVSAVFGITSLWLSGFMHSDQLLLGYLTWFIGDGVGVLLFAPLFLSMKFTPATMNSTSMSERTGFYLTCALMPLLWLLDLTAFNLVYLVIPVLFWALLRFNLRHTFAAAVYVSAAGIVMTSINVGPFQFPTTLESILTLQVFVVLTFGSIFMIAQLLRDSDLAQAAQLLQAEELKKTNEDLQQALRDKSIAERLAAHGRIAGGVAHELNNPMMGLVGYIERAKASSVDANIRDSLEKALTAADRMKSIVSRLQTYSMSDSETEDISLSTLMEAGISPYRDELERLGVQLTVDTGNCGVRARREDLIGVIRPVLQNALEAVAEKDRREISISAHCAGQQVTIEIQDNGEGIAPGILPTIFDPFVTTKPVGKHAGLGLTSAKNLVERYAGTISATTNETGALVTVRLPAASY